MIGAYLTDSISIKYASTLDQYNRPTYTTVAVMARVEWSNRLIRNAQGEQVVSAARVYLDGDIDEPTTADLVVLGGKDHVIMRVDKQTDFSMSHYEIWIQ